MLLRLLFFLLRNISDLFFFSGSAIQYCGVNPLAGFDDPSVGETIDTPPGHPRATRSALGKPLRPASPVTDLASFVWTSEANANKYEDKLLARAAGEKYSGEFDFPDPPSDPDVEMPDYLLPVSDEEDESEYLGGSEVSSNASDSSSDAFSDWSSARNSPAPGPTAGARRSARLQSQSLVDEPSFDLGSEESSDASNSWKGFSDEEYELAKDDRGMFPESGAYVWAPSSSSDEDADTADA